MYNERLFNTEIEAVAKGLQILNDHQDDNSDMLYIPENIAVVKYPEGKNRFIYFCDKPLLRYIELNDIYLYNTRGFETTGVYTCSVITLETECGPNAMLHGYFSDSTRILLNSLKKDFRPYINSTKLNFYFNVNNPKSTPEEYLEIIKSFSNDLFSEVCIGVNFLKSEYDYVQLD